MAKIIYNIEIICLRQKERETGRERVNEKEATSKWKKHKEDNKKKQKE